MVANILNRTLIIPPAAPHTTKYYNYDKVKKEDLIPFSELIEINKMKELVDLQILTNTTFKNFIEYNKNNNDQFMNWTILDRSNLREKRDDPWSKERVYSLYNDDNNDVLFFSKGSMWQCFNFTSTDMKKIQSYVRFHPLLRHTARLLSNSFDDKFNALHIRFADGDSSQERVGWLKPSHAFLSRMKNGKFLTTSKNLYIATVPNKQNSGYFNRFKSYFNVTFSTDLPQEPIKNVLKYYPTRMHSTVLGIIEQLLCTRAYKFLGTGYSTFSEHIRTMRANRILASDPWIDNGGVYIGVLNNNNNINIDNDNKNENNLKQLNLYTKIKKNNNKVNIIKSSLMKTNNGIEKNNILIYVGMNGNITEKQNEEKFLNAITLCKHALKVC